MRTPIKTQHAIKAKHAELIRDALDDLIENGISGFNLLQADLCLTTHGDHIIIQLLTKKGDIAYFDDREYAWLTSVECPQCGKEEWSNDGECSCPCTVLPEYDNPDRDD